MKSVMPTALPVIVNVAGVTATALLTTVVPAADVITNEPAVLESVLAALAAPDEALIANAAGVTAKLYVAPDAGRKFC
jgi:hypothetical protein